jgi:hypothetical protein
MGLLWDSVGLNRMPAGATIRAMSTQGTDPTVAAGGDRSPQEVRNTAPNAPNPSTSGHGVRRGPRNDADGWEIPGHDGWRT